MELEAHPGHPGEPRRRCLIRTSADQSASRLTAITPRKKPQAEIPRASPQGYGDGCLKAVAGALQGAVTRAGDTVARYGGEEFSVIPPNTDQGGAAIIAERMRHAVEDLGLEHQGSTAATVVTVSLGGATAILDSLDAGELVKAADAALYSSKRAGRNRFTTSEVASAFLF